jgi:hypothetical protein
MVCLPALPAAGGILWRKDFGGGEAFTGLVVDPLDRRRLVLCGARGSFIVLRWVFVCLGGVFFLFVSFFFLSLNSCALSAPQLL